MIILQSRSTAAAADRATTLLSTGKTSLFCSFSPEHTDYHKPSDDADKINYTGQLSIIKYIYRVNGLKTKKKLAFTKTREAASTGKSSFKVSLGIMPDYTFSGTGVHVDGISEGKAAQKAGIKNRDVIIQLGPHKVTDVQEYMQVLAKV